MQAQVVEYESETDLCELLRKNKFEHEFLCIKPLEVELYPTYLDVCLEQFKDKRVGLVYTDYNTFIDGTPSTVFCEPFSRTRLAQLNIIPPTAVVSREVLSQVKEFKNLHDLWLQVTVKCVAIHVAETLCQHKNKT